MTCPAFGDFQLEIYLAGLQGVLPSFPMAFAELQARAEQALPPSVLSYVAGGAGSEHTQRANVSAFRQWGLIPRMFVGAARRDMSVELFGMTLPSPLLMAPIGVIGLCAQDGHGDGSGSASAGPPRSVARRNVVAWSGRRMTSQITW
jgi:lactate 2-monooxygenase